MMNLLESAGFSRANPYYVVQQGKVCCLCSHAQSHFSWHVLASLEGGPWNAAHCNEPPVSSADSHGPRTPFSFQLSDSFLQIKDGSVVVSMWVLLQIMAMSTMKDAERLELLKEIGGTKVYEERRRESLKILHETDNRRSRILEVVRHRIQCGSVCHASRQI